MLISRSLVVRTSIISPLISNLVRNFKIKFVYNSSTTDFPFFFDSLFVQVSANTLTVFTKMERPWSRVNHASTYAHVTCLSIMKAFSVSPCARDTLTGNVVLDGTISPGWCLQVPLSLAASARRWTAFHLLVSRLSDCGEPFKRFVFSFFFDRFTCWTSWWRNRSRWSTHQFMMADLTTYWLLLSFSLFLDCTFKSAETPFNNRICQSSRSQSQLFCLCFASSKILWRHMRGRYHCIVNTAMITGACLIMIVLMHVVDLALLCLAKFGIL